MHISEKIVIPMLVIFRFIPTIRDEYHAISDAMRMRGISFRGKKPLEMIEYRIVPLMISVVKIWDELSAASLTRGLGAPVKRTNICRIGFGFTDFIFISCVSYALRHIFCRTISVFCSKRYKLYRLKM